MESKTKELVKAGHELVVLLGTQHGMHDAASLVQRLTVRLDTTAAAWQEMKKRHDDSVKAERAWETTMMQACGEDGPKSVAGKFAALEAERDALAAENAGLKVSISEGSQWDGEQWVGLSAETPATAAFLREQRAVGAELCVKSLVTSDDDDFVDAPNICANVAAQLRAGEAV